MDIQTLIVLYLLFALPWLVRSLLLLGANIYRAGQTNSAPPPLIEIPHIPRFKVGVGGNEKKRDESERLPDV